MLNNLAKSFGPPYSTTGMVKELTVYCMILEMMVAVIKLRLDHLTNMVRFEMETDWLDFMLLKLVDTQSSFHPSLDLTLQVSSKLQREGIRA